VHASGASGGRNNANGGIGGAIIMWRGMWRSALARIRKRNMAQMSAKIMAKWRRNMLAIGESVMAKRKLISGESENGWKLAAKWQYRKAASASMAYRRKSGGVKRRKHQRRSKWRKQMRKWRRDAICGGSARRRRK